MTKLSKIDKNMENKSTSTENNIIYRSAKEFDIYGTNAINEDGYYRFNKKERDFINPINDGVAWLSYHSSGISIRFLTDSTKIFIKGENQDKFNMNNETLVGQCGMSLYVYDEKERMYVLHEVLRFSVNDICYNQNICNFNTKKLRKYILYLPLYMGVKELEIGLEEDSIIENNPYTNSLKVGVYGTSITQGCSASHPGMSYTSYMSRLLDAEVYNFGFSGAAFLEKEIATVLRERDLDILIIDAEPNAGCDERLKNNLYPFLNEYLEKKPKTRIIIVSRTLFALDNYDMDRVKLRKFYKKFQEEAVKHYNSLGYNFNFIDGSKIIKKHYSEHSSDGVHPDNYQMVLIAKRMTKEILKQE